MREEIEDWLKLLGCIVMGTIITLYVVAMVGSTAVGLYDVVFTGTPCHGPHDFCTEARQP